ncbi:hypothetical protein L2E82_24503 [Cichorium intybus]|uniref:Uncharacterized protein n=1 Tax=Cichorium intybus TaxID=13427 RepID=A0ACB9E1B1_CICIN|nr:hypothetical protein L2E82_24503 [Cichorium intybus]
MPILKNRNNFNFNFKVANNNTPRILTCILLKRGLVSIIVILALPRIQLKLETEHGRCFKWVNGCFLVMVTS